MNIIDAAMELLRQQHPANDREFARAKEIAQAIKDASFDNFAQQNARDVAVETLEKLNLLAPDIYPAPKSKSNRHFGNGV